MAKCGLILFCIFTFLILFFVFTFICVIIIVISFELISCHINPQSLYTALKYKCHLECRLEPIMLKSSLYYHSIPEFLRWNNAQLILSLTSEKHSSHWHPSLPCSSSSLLSLRIRMSWSSYWLLFALSSLSWLCLIYFLPLKNLWCAYHSSIIKRFWIAVIFPYFPLSPVASDESARNPVLFWGSSNTIIGLWITYCEYFGCYEYLIATII